MKKFTQTGLVISMIFLSATAFSQHPVSGLYNNSEIKRTAKTYFDLMINVISTNLNYGSSNGGLANYKKSNNGIQAGVSFQAGITPGFSIVSELYFIRKGGKLTANNPLNSGASSLRLNSIEMPVLARVHVGQFYMNAGPSIAYNLGGTSKIADVSDKLAFSNSVDGFKRFDAGVQMGAGVEFPFKQRRIALDIRYNYGLTNISYKNEIYNRAVMVSVHFSKPWKTNPFARNRTL